MVFFGARRFLGGRGEFLAGAAKVFSGKTGGMGFAEVYFGGCDRPAARVAGEIRILSF